MLAGCPQAPSKPQDDAGDAIAEGRQEVSVYAAPILAAIRGAGQVITEPLPDPEPRKKVHPEALDLIVGFEISSPAYYRARLQGVICPGAASGPTWGIGYDGGHQSADRIRADWHMHPAVGRLATTAGQAGPGRCRAARDRLRDVRVPLADATRVFDNVMVPTWLGATRRAYPGIDELAARPEGALVSNTFNRGASMAGSRAIEKRHIRDVCVPRGDVDCIAAQLRASCRIWRGTDVGNGLCRRREAEAALAEKTDDS